MADLSELRRLLSLVNSRDVIQALDPFRIALERDIGGDVLRFLTAELENLHGRIRAGVGYVLAEHYRKTGNLAALQRLFASDDPDFKKLVLNALTGEAAPSNPQMGEGIVSLALDGARHPMPGVRTASCSVIQNQSAWGVDVSAAVEPLLTLLDDPSGDVRMQAACAVGNLAKAKYKVSSHIQALRFNLRNEVSWVRGYNAWALWQLSRSRHDISAAVDDLVTLLASNRDDDDEARKNAAGALLHHAKKSPENGTRVKEIAKATRFDASRKQVRRFQEQLAAIC